MNISQARAHLEEKRNDLRGQAASCRAAADDYRRAASGAEDSRLASVQWDQSSRYAAQARSFDREAEAIDLLLSAVTTSNGL